MNLYVGNLGPQTKLEDLRAAFERHGEVSSVTLPGFGMHAGRSTGANRGYAFVLMPDKAQARAAQSALHLLELHGRAMTVQLAREGPPRRPRR